MGGSSVRITTFGYPPKIYETATEDGGVLFTGYEVDMLKILGKRLNFQPRFRKTTDGHKWGAFFAQNETYNGLKGALYVYFTHLLQICKRVEFPTSGDLQFKLTDVGIANVYKRFGDVSYVDHSYPYTYDSYCFLVYQPRSSFNWLSLVQPMTYRTW